MPESAPDYLGPLEEWRVWRVVERDGRTLLGSVVMPTLWLPGEPLVATCLVRRRIHDRLRRRARHPAPVSSCDCGIYAAPLDGCVDYLRAVFRNERRVVGRVALWGTVVECERGFRASHAYPRRLYVPVRPGEKSAQVASVIRALGAYAVPVDTVAAEPSCTETLLDVS